MLGKSEIISLSDNAYKMLLLPSTPLVLSLLLEHEISRALHRKLFLPSSAVAGAIQQHAA